MQIEERTDRVRGLAWATILTLALSVPAIAQGQEPSATTPEKADAVKGEDDGYEWMMDEARGRRYRVDRVPKVENTYRRVSETEVRFPGGARLEVVDESEDWFYVKVYERLARETAPVSAPKGPTEEQLAEAAAAYETEYETVDRLTFNPFDKGLPRSGQWRNGFDVADMNGDGHMDIVFGPARKGRSHPNIFLGDGAGNWKRWTEVKYPPAPYDYGDVAVGDLDGDGHQDMVFGIHLRGMFVARSTGEGAFEPWTQGVEVDMPGAGGDATSFSSRAVQLLDWNGDGKLDIVALGEGPKGLKTRQDKKGKNQLINTSRGFLVYLNNGDGSWTVHAQERGDKQRANFGDSFAVDDVNGDGNWDLLTATRQMGSRWILAETSDTKLTYKEIPAVRPRAFIDGTAIADMDNDGHKDLVVSYRNNELNVWRSGIDILYGQEDGAYRAEPLYSAEGRSTIASLSLGNLNGDDRLDLAAGNGDGVLFVFLSEGKKGFVAEKSKELHQKRLGCQAFDITLVDLDGDGLDELATGFAGEQTGYPGFPNMSKPGCIREGSIRVWKAANNS